MFLQYFPDTDMFYIGLTEGTSSESEEVAPGIVLDFDQHNQIIGIEIENAGKFIDLSRLELESLPITTLTRSQEDGSRKSMP